MVKSYRDDILTLLQEHAPQTLRLNEISHYFSIPSHTDEYQDLRLELDQLVQEGAIYRSSRRRYGLHETMETTFEGLLSVHGFTGVVTTNSSQFPTITVKRHHLGTALHGDHVRVKLLALKHGAKPNGEILAVLQRSQTSMVGRIEFNGDFFFLIPDDNRIHVDILIHPSRLGGAKDGDKVAANFLRWTDPHKSPEGTVVEILGEAGVPKVEYASILKEFRLSKEFPEAVEHEANSVAVSPAKTEIARRVDMRGEVVITIDPVDARDFDDALSLQILDNGNYRVGVHIADVSHYVQEDSNLDKEALERATSVYLVDGVVPMLPERLSNDVCSLVPHQDRLAYSVFMEFSKRGVLKDYSIRETIINSTRRFTYEEAQNIIDTGEGDHSELLLLLHRFATVLRKRRFTKGGIDFDTMEIKFLLDENKVPVEAVLKKRSDATSLVEEYMLAANQTVATHIKSISPGKGRNKKSLLPFIYRIHDEPDDEKFGNAMELMRAFGIPVPEDLTSKDINDLLQQVQERPEKHVVNQVLLRSMAKAVYSSYNIGHYGLGFQNYAHFTSPIRRYPDLIIHRLLKEFAQGIPSSQRIGYLAEHLNVVSDHSSARERFAVEAERASIKLTQVAIVKEKIGETFNGMVTGVTNFGLFVMIDDLYAEGLVRMREMDDDFYFFDERRYALVGRKTRKVFRIGTRLHVKIVKANVEKREIDFAYAGPERLLPQEGEREQTDTNKSLNEPLPAEEVERTLRSIQRRSSTQQKKTKSREKSSLKAKRSSASSTKQKKQSPAKGKNKKRK